MWSGLHTVLGANVLNKTQSFWPQGAQWEKRKGFTGEGKWMTWSHCPHRDQSSTRMSSEDDKTIGECQKAKNLGSILICNEITLSPERFGSPQKWGWGQHRGTEQPRPGLPVRAQLLENHQGTCANGDPLTPRHPMTVPCCGNPQDWKD